MSEPTADAASDLRAEQNCALVFVKPAALTAACVAHVRERLKAEHLIILRDREVDGGTIEADGLIDRHYYSASSKALSIQPANIVNVDANAFTEVFGGSWQEAVAAGSVVNAAVALAAQPGLTPAGLEAWSS